MKHGPPECTARFYPSQGQGSGSGIEGYGQPGEKESGGMAPYSSAGNTGDMNTAAQAQNAADHSRPMVHEYPENTTGSLDDYADNPTKAEGSKANQ
jgi:hypothetical protein